MRLYLQWKVFALQEMVTGVSFPGINFATLHTSLGLLRGVRYVAGVNSKLEIFCIQNTRGLLGSDIVVHT